MTLVTSPPLRSYALEPLQFFDARPDGLKLLAEGEEVRKVDSFSGIQPIVRFVRTPDGEGLAVIRADDSVETWSVDINGKGEVCCSVKGGEAKIDQLAVLAHGQCLDFVIGLRLTT